MNSLTKSELSFIQEALNGMWYNATIALERKDLGDIERSLYEKTKAEAKRLIDKIEKL